MSDDERGVMEHALGLRIRRGRPYRNHFCAGEDHCDWPILQRLCARGWMRRAPGSELSGGSEVFVVTDDGKQAIAAANEASAAAVMREIGR